MKLNMDKKIDQFISSDFSSFASMIDYAITLRDRGDQINAIALLKLIAGLDEKSIFRAYFHLAVIEYARFNYQIVLNYLEKVNLDTLRDSRDALKVATLIKLNDVQAATEMLEDILAREIQLASTFFSNLLLEAALKLLTEKSFKNRISRSGKNNSLSSGLLEWWKIPDIRAISAKFNAASWLKSNCEKVAIHDTKHYINFMVGLICARSSRDANHYNHVMPHLVKLVQNDNIKKHLSAYTIKAIIKVFPSLEHHFDYLANNFPDKIPLKNSETVPVQELKTRLYLRKIESHKPTLRTSFFESYSSLIKKFSTKEKVVKSSSPSSFSARVCFFGQIRSTFEDLNGLVESIKEISFKSIQFDISTWENAGDRIPPNLSSLVAQCDDHLKNYIFNEVSRKDLDFPTGITKESFFASNYPITSVFSYVEGLRQFYEAQEEQDPRVKGFFNTTCIWSQEDFNKAYNFFMDAYSDKSKFDLSKQGVKNQFRMWYCIGNYVEQILNSNDNLPELFFFVRPDLEPKGSWSIPLLSSETFFCDIEPDCLMTGSGGLGDRYFIIPKAHLRLLTIPLIVMRDQSIEVDDLFMGRMHGHQFLESIIFSSGLSIDFTSSHLPFIIKRRLRNMNEFQKFVEARNLKA